MIDPLDRRLAPRRRAALGSTLVELLVVLVVMALLLGVVTPALTAVPAGETASDDERVRLAAIRSGRMVVTDSLVALPDGRVVRRARDR